MINLSKKFRELFLSIKKGLKEIDLTKYKIQLLGIFGGGNRLAILRVLNYKKYKIKIMQLVQDKKDCFMKALNSNMKNLKI